MRDLAPFNFGLIIAYLVPGFVALWGASYHSEIVHGWLVAAPRSAPTVGDLYYATVASVACGMIVSAFRWALIDTVHHWTGVRMPPWDFSLLRDRLDAYQLLVEFHYRYYQFFANMLIALAFSSVAHALRPAANPPGWSLGNTALVIVCVVLFFTSRDALRKYYRRAGELLTHRGKEVCHGEWWRQSPPSRAEERGGQDRRCRQAGERPAVEAAVHGQAADQVTPAGNAG